MRIKQSNFHIAKNVVILKVMIQTIMMLMTTRMTIMIISSRSAFRVG